MGLFRFLGVLSPIHISFVTLFSGAKKVGTDCYGNRYFEASPRKGYKRNRRWVMYNGAPEPSRIPPEWHGWIHHQTNTVPADGAGSYRRPWQKAPLANMTGTTQAYHPKGHVLEGGKRDSATGDYEAWRP